MIDINDLKHKLNDVIKYLESEFSQIRTGRASAELIESVQVEAYGSPMELKGVASISVADAKSLLVEPWDKTLVDSIAHALSNTDLGLSAVIDGQAVRVKIPDMTEERRKSYAKVVAERSEQARQSVRQIRQKFMKEIDTEVKNGMSEDTGKRLKDEVEKAVKECNSKIEEMHDKKVEDLMTV